jgi:hypothetical protein
MIDLCKIFGVEEGEEFEFTNRMHVYRVVDNILQYSKPSDNYWERSCAEINNVSNSEIKKLPKRKEFTDDELAIMRSLPKKYEYITRDRIGHMYLYTKKPTKFENEWTISCCMDFTIFNTLFNSIKWEDEEPVFIDDYVER